MLKGDKKRLQEKVKVGNMCKIFLLSFRTLTLNQNLRNITRYNSDCYPGLSKSPLYPVLSKGLGSRQVFDTHWLDKITAAWWIHLLVDTAWNKSSHIHISVPKSLLILSILSFSHPFPRVMDRPSASQSLQRVRMSILNTEKNWYFCIFPKLSL